MTILIIGAPDEEHSAYIYDKLTERGESVYYLDTRLYPMQLRVAMGEDAMRDGILQFSEDGPRIPFDEVRSVYWRTHYGTNVDASITDGFLQEMAYREIESALGSLCRVTDISLQPEDQPGWLWVNGAEAIVMHRFKHYQLQKLHQLGIRVPKTLVTNDPQSAREFYDRLNGEVIFKPVRGGAHTAKMSPEDLTDERLTELAKSPVQFQEMIPGVDVRVYKVGEHLFAAEIRSSTLDFRDDPGAAIVPVELPDDIQKQCHQLASALQLHFSGIDVRRTPEGEYVFIEGNPSPMFIHFEAMSGYPISDSLIELLQAGPSAVPHKGKFVHA